MPHCNAGSYVLLAIGTAFLLYAMYNVYTIMSIVPEFKFNELGKKTVVSEPFFTKDTAMVFHLKSEGDCDDVYNKLTIKWDCKVVDSRSTENLTFISDGYCYNGVDDDTFASDVKPKATKDCKTEFMDNYTIVANFSGYDYNTTHCSSCPKGPGQFTVTATQDIWVHWELDSAWKNFAEALFGVVQLIAAVIVSIVPACCCFCACMSSCIVWLVSSPPLDPAAMQQAQVQMGQMPPYGMQQPAMGYPQ